MSPDEAIRQILGGAAGVVDLVPLGSIFCGADVPEGESFPTIVCMLNTDAPEMNLDGPSGLSQAEVEIQAQAIDDANISGLVMAKRIGAAIAAALNGYRGRFGDRLALGIFTQGPTDLEPDREALIFGTTVTATIWVR